MTSFEWFLLVIVVILVPLIVAIVVTLWTIDQANKRRRANRSDPQVGVKRKAALSEVEVAQRRAARAERDPLREVATSPAGATPILDHPVSYSTSVSEAVIDDTPAEVTLNEAVPGGSLNETVISPEEGTRDVHAAETPFPDRGVEVDPAPLDRPAIASEPSAQDVAHRENAAETLRVTANPGVDTSQTNLTSDDASEPSGQSPAQGSQSREANSGTADDPSA